MENNFIRVKPNNDVINDVIFLKWPSTNNLIDFSAKIYAMLNEFLSMLIVLNELRKICFKLVLEDIFISYTLEQKIIENNFFKNLDRILVIPTQW